MNAFKELDGADEVWKASFLLGCKTHFVLGCSAVIDSVLWFMLLSCASETVIMKTHNPHIFHPYLTWPVLWTKWQIYLQLIIPYAAQLFAFYRIKGTMCSTFFSLLSLLKNKTTKQKPPNLLLPMYNQIQASSSVFGSVWKLCHNN